MRLQRRANGLSLLGTELKGVHHPLHSRFEVYHLITSAKHHDVAELKRAEVFSRHWAEKVHAALVDAQDDYRRKQVDGVLDAADLEEETVAWGAGVIGAGGEGGPGAGTGG